MCWSSGTAQGTGQLGSCCLCRSQAPSWCQALCGWRAGRAGGLRCRSWGSWGLGEGAREQEGSEPAGKMATGCVAAGGRTRARNQLSAPEAAGPRDGGSSCKASNRSLGEPPCGPVLRGVGWRWPPPRQWLSVEEGAWVTVVAGQQAVTHGACHCRPIVRREVSCRVSDDLARRPQPGDCDHPREGRGPVVPHRGPALTVRLALCGEVLVLLSAWLGRLLLTNLVCHRALTMASAWERNYCHSELEKAAAFLPSILRDRSIQRDLDTQTVHGVLLFADISGGVSSKEQPRTHRPFGGLPLPLRQSGHLVTAEVFCWDAHRVRDGLSWAVNHCCQQH